MAGGRFAYVEEHIHVLGTLICVLRVTLSKSRTQLEPGRLIVSTPTTTDDATRDSEVYAEGTALTELFGDGPKVKILAAFLAEPDFDHNVTDIARLSGVTRKTVYKHLDDLLELGVVEKTRETGGSPRYKLDKENEAAKLVGQLEWELIDLAFGE